MRHCGGYSRSASSAKNRGARVVSATTTRSFPHWRLSGRATVSAEPRPERGPARLCAEPDAHRRAALRGAPRSARGRWRGNPASPDLSKPNCQDYQESRLGTEKREPPETLGRILDSPGLSKTNFRETMGRGYRASIDHLGKRAIRPQPKCHELCTIVSSNENCRYMKFIRKY